MHAIGHRGTVRATKTGIGPIHFQVHPSFGRLEGAYTSVEKGNVMRRGRPGGSVCRYHLPLFPVVFGPVFLKQDYFRGVIELLNARPGTFGVSGAEWSGPT